MSDDQVIAICATLVALSVIGLAALRLWLKHKESME